MLAKSGQGSIPEEVEVGKPMADLVEVIGAQPVDVLPAQPLLGNEANIEQDAKVLRYRRSGDRQRRG